MRITFIVISAQYFCKETQAVCSDFVQQLQGEKVPVICVELLKEAQLATQEACISVNEPLLE